MPASQHLTKLTYLFEVAADEHAPVELKNDILDYLHSDLGLSRVMAALMPLEQGDDVTFETLAQRARPLAQANRVHDILSAFAEELPTNATLKQALVFARVAQGHYLNRTGQGDLAQRKTLMADSRLPKDLGHTLHTALAVFFEPIDPETLPDERNKPVKLSAEGVALLRRVLHRMHESQRERDGLAANVGDDPVQSITDHIRRGR